MSHRLATTQRAFTRGIREAGGQETPPGLPGDRYAVYRDLVYRNLESLLAGGFPVLRATLLEEQWETLVREFLADHRAQTPLFLELGREFVEFLRVRETQGWEPGWLRELAEYERVELELAIAPDAADTYRPVKDEEIATSVLRLAPLARLLCYEYPVHRIGPEYDPAPEPTFLLVYRDADDEVQFMTLMPATAQLLALVEDNRSTAAQELLRQLAADLSAPLEPLQTHGLAQLKDFLERGVVTCG